MTPILLYHQITAEHDPDDPFRLSVSPANFAAQMELLARKGYECVSLSEALRLRGSGGSGQKTFAVTFDDGYLDNYETAYPILQQFGFIATIFTVTDFVGRTLPWPSKREVTFMNWDQIAEMTASGFDFGAHTVTHPNLPDVSAAEAESEIRQSKKVLEEKLGRPVPFIAYPGGHQTADIHSMAQNAGFEAGLGVDIGPDAQFNRWRVQITGGDSLTLFRLKASGYFEQLKQFRQSSAVAHRITQTAGKVLNRWR